MNLIKRLWKEEEGASMVEYAILVVLIALVAISAISTLGENITQAFTDAANATGDV